MKQTRYGVEVLHWAGMKDKFLPKLQEILVTNPEFTNFESKFGENALHIAARVNNFEIAKWLIEESGIDYKKTSSKGNALLIAIDSSSFEIANYLIQNTDIDFRAVNSEGKNIFHFLMRGGNDKLIQVLLEKYPEGINALDKNNENYIGSKNAVLMPKDDGGKLGRVKITVVGKDDKEKKVIKEMSGDDMLDYLDKHDGKIEFEVPKEVLSAKDGDSRLMVECADCSVDEGGKTNKVKKIYGKDTEADTEIAEDDVPMESNSSDVKSVETNNDKAVYIIGAILLFVLIIAILIIVYYMRKKMKEKKDNDEQ